MRIALLLLLSAALVLPAGAFAASPTNPPLPGSSTSPFTPGIPQSQATQPTTTTTPTVVNTSTTSSNGSLSSSSIAAIAIGAVVVLLGISLFIWRDARRRAPVRQRTAALAAGAAGRNAAKQRVKQRKLSPAERRRRKRGRAK